MASPFVIALAAAVASLTAGAAMACPDPAACGGMSRHYGYYTEQASFGPMADSAADSAYEQAYGEPVYAGQGYDGQAYGDQAYQDQDQGQGYGDAGEAPPPAYGPPHYDPRYDAGSAAYGDEARAYGPPPVRDQRYGAQGRAWRQGYEHQAYASRGYSTSSRSSSTRVSGYGYDSGWRRVPAGAAGHGQIHRGNSFAALSVSESDYDSGWQVRQGRTEVRGGVFCPPGSAYERPDARYGCPLAAGNPVAVPTSFFYDTGGAGPDFISGGGGGGGGVIVEGGARSGGFAFASARASASASVHVGGHFGRGGHGGHGGHHGGHGCGCGGHH